MNKPQGRNNWGVLVIVGAVIVGSITYVFSSSDDKMVLGNQPFPVQMSEGYSQAAAFVPPKVFPPGGGQLGSPAINVPSGGNTVGARSTPVGNGTCTGVLTCPQCGTPGIPVCTECNVVMHIFDAISGLYICPSCGAAGVPICSNCGAVMTAVGRKAPNGRPNIGADPTFVAMA